MKHLIYIILLLVLALPASAKNHPIAIKVKHEYLSYGNDLSEAKAIVIFNSKAKQSQPFTLKWSFTSEDGRVLLEGEDAKQLDIYGRTDEYDYTYKLPAKIISLQKEHTITFSCLLSYKGKVIGKESRTVNTPARASRLSNASLIPDAYGMQVNYSCSDESFTPRVNLYINGELAETSIYSKKYVRLKEIAEKIKHTPRLNEEFTWQFKLVDKRSDEVIDSTAVAKATCRPATASVENVTWTVSGNELVVHVSGVTLRNSGTLRPGIWASLYTSQGLVRYTDSKYKAHSATANTGSLNGDGYYRDLTIRVPLYPVFGAHGSSFSGSLVIHLYDGTEWTRLSSSPISLSDLGFADPNALFRSELPIFNQHNGPVIVLFDMPKCTPSYVWRKKLYEPRINQWRAWGAQFYYYMMPFNNAPMTNPFPNEKMLSEDIYQWFKVNQPVSSAPTTMIFDGYGNCLYRHDGIRSNDTEKDRIELEEVLQRIAKSYK